LRPHREKIVSRTGCSRMATVVIPAQSDKEHGSDSPSRSIYS
jgi:hypothetical protein